MEFYLKLHDKKVMILNCRFFKSNMNKKLKIRGAVNFTRKSNIKEKIQNKPYITTLEEAVLSRKMGHSVATQKTYMTGVKK